ncbi:unnamed protein product [Prorocentrum cordatum]|uniref:Pentatricopeptide repeat-containing protein n=1 Tax=Prorocentrum cordatum TaxID=2364126 RepID=A0ABN9QBB0_9DINO|nr:unnamed protein product [Polarella glacialis]
MRSWSPTSYNVVVSACEKSKQWQWALALLCEMMDAKLEPDVVSYTLSEVVRATNATSVSMTLEAEPLKRPAGRPDGPDTYNVVVSACEKSKQWQWALALLCEMMDAKLEPDVVSYTLSEVVRATNATSVSMTLEAEPLKRPAGRPDGPDTPPARPGRVQDGHTRRSD